MQNRAATISKYKWLNFHDVTKENRTKHNPNWPYIPGYPRRILIIRGSWKTNTNDEFNKPLIRHL